MGYFYHPGSRSQSDVTFPSYDPDIALSFFSFIQIVLAVDLASVLIHLSSDALTVIPQNVHKRLFDREEDLTAQCHDQKLSSSSRF